MENLKATDTFITHGLYAISNLGGYLVQISEDGDMARMKDCFGGDSKSEEVSDWKEIIYQERDDGSGYMDAIIDLDGFNIPLDRVMKS